MGAGRWLGRVLLLGWELPQNVLGLGFLALQELRGRVRRVVFDRERMMIELHQGAAVSLGLFVFWTGTDNPYVPVGRENADHEWGHSVQSRWLGPAYLAVVGLPSQLRVFYALAHRALTGRRWAHYYDGFPENWADRLGGVDRSLRPPP
jgi:hypothetical protein